MNVTWRSAAGIVGGLAAGVGLAFLLRGTVAPQLFENMGTRKAFRIVFHLLSHPVERRWELLTVVVAGTFTAAGIAADRVRQARRGQG